MPAIALTDVGGLYAAVPFQQACQAVGIKPILGAELTLAGGVSATFLACSLAGFGNLCRLISLHHLSEHPLERVAEHVLGEACGPRPSANHPEHANAVHGVVGQPVVPVDAPKRVGVE